MKLFLALAFLPFLAHALTIPEQVSNIPVGTWGQVTGSNSVKDIDPEKDPSTNKNFPNGAWYRGSSGFKGAFEAWDGCVFAPERGKEGAMLCYGGGHFDYYGSGVYQFDPSGTPTWSRLSDPYDPGGKLPTSPAPTGIYPDGSPQPTHTAQTLAWTGTELVVLGAQVSDTPLQWKPMVMLFNPVTKKWRGPYANSGSTWGAAIWDSKRKLVCWQAYTGASSYPGTTTKYQCFNPVTNVTTEYQPAADNQLNNYGYLMGYNPELDLVTQFAFYKSPPYLQYQIADRDNGNFAVNWKRGVMVNRPPDNEMSGFGSVSWSAHRKAWIWFPDLAKTGFVYEVKTTLVGGLPTHTFSNRLNTDASKPSCGNQPTCGGGSYNKFAVFTLTSPKGTYEALCGILTLAGGDACFNLGQVAPPPPSGPTCMPPEFQGLPVCGAPVPPGPITGFTCPPGALFCEDFTTGHTGAFYAGNSGIPRIEAGRMVIEVPPNSTGNNHGGISEIFPRIRPGEMLAFTYQREVDSATADLAGMKEFIVKYYGASCQGGSFVQTHYPERARWIRPYTACGAVSFDKWSPDMKRLILNGSGPPANFDCDYQDKVKNDPNVTNCVTTKPGIPQTYYVEMRIGHYGSPDSTIDMWQKNGSGPCLLYAHVDNFRFEAGTGFEEVLFDAYITGRTADVTYPAGKVTFDNIAGSKQGFKSEVCG